MVATPKQIIKLPLYGVMDGDQVQDEFGNIFEFNTELNTWICKGIKQSAGLVSYENNGLISPTIHEKLTLIQTLQDNGIRFDQFKLDTSGPVPYFYYFHSSDDLIRFYPEGASKLRLEIDRNRLIRKLTSQCCVGPKGVDGIQGLSGLDGEPAANEVFQSPTSTKNSTFTFETTVTTPIDTPISLRLYRGTSIIVEFLVTIGGTSSDILVTPIDDTIEVENTSLNINYDITTEKLFGSIKFTAGAEDISTWKYKARQKGPKGDKGKDGFEFFEIVEQFFDDPLLRSPDAIISLRKPNTNNNVFFIKKSLFSEVCTSNLLPSPTLTRGKIDKAVFVGIRVSPANCKDIGRYKFIPDPFEPPPLNLPAWTPTPDCCNATFCNVRGFNWFDKVEPALPFQILEEECLPAQCCQEDFFWCPNLGDSCPVEGEIQPPPKPEFTSSSSSFSDTNSYPSSSSRDSSPSYTFSITGTSSTPSSSSDMPEEPGDSDPAPSSNDPDGFIQQPQFIEDPPSSPSSSSVSSSSSLAFSDPSSISSSVSSSSDSSSSLEISTETSPSSPSSSSVSSSSQGLSDPSSPSSPSSSSASSSSLGLSDPSSPSSPSSSSASSSSLGFSDPSSPSSLSPSSLSSESSSSGA